MSKSKLVWFLMLPFLPTGAGAQTGGGVGVPIVLPEVEISDTARRLADGTIGETSDIAGIRKPILQIPRAVYTVTPKTLQQQQPQSLGEALESVPGIFIADANGGFADIVTLRGFTVTSADVFIVGSGGGLLIDGIRSPFTRSFNANTESISVLSGPAALLYGVAEAGGVIDLERKLPLTDPHYAVGLVGGAVAGVPRDIAGTFDFTGPVYKSTEMTLAYRLVGSAARDAPWRQGDTTTRDFLLAPTFALYSDVVTATLAFEHERNQQPYDRGVTSVDGAPLQIPRSVSYSEAYSNFDENVNWLHSQIDWHIDKSDDIRFRASYAATDNPYDEVRSDFQNDFDPTTGDIQRTHYWNTGNEQRQSYVFLSGVHRFDLGPIRNELLVGADYYNAMLVEADEYSQAYEQPFNLYNPVYGSFATGPVVDAAKLFNLPPGQPLNTQKSSEVGTFAQEAATYGPLTLQGGGRFTSIATYARFLGLAMSDSTEQAFTPSAQALLAVDPALSFYASYSQGLRPNTYVADVGLDVKYAGPVVPERGVGYETGVKCKLLDGALLAQASVFDITRMNVATFDPETMINSLSQTQHSRGAQVSAVGRLTPNIDVNAYYAYQRVRITADLPVADDIGDQVPNAPSSTFAAFANYHFLDGPLNHLTLSAGVFGASGNPVDEINSFSLPGFAIVSVGAAYDYQASPTTPLYRAAVKVNNLGDATYYPSTGSRTNFITVGEPRNVLVSLSASL